MLARSFRLVAARLIPRAGRRKQALLVVVPILAGCGGSGHQNLQTVRLSAPGFSFAAPAGWPVRRAATRVTAAHGVELVQVVALPLQRSYSEGLFAAVERELAGRMRALARASGGTLSAAPAVTVAGIRSHSYRVDGGGAVAQYTFVLRGRREFQLLCRRRASDSDEMCRQLLTSFRVAR